jgi:hypothetical protein
MNTLVYKRCLWCLMRWRTVKPCVLVYKVWHSLKPFPSSKDLSHANSRQASSMQLAKHATWWWIPRFITLVRRARTEDGESAHDVQVPEVCVYPHVSNDLIRPETPPISINRRRIRPPVPIKARIYVQWNCFFVPPRSTLICPYPGPTCKKRPVHIRAKGLWRYPHGQHAVGETDQSPSCP